MSSCRITCPTRPLAFGSSLGPGSLSRTTGRTPASASSQASIRPLGPAPEMTTSAASTVISFSSWLGGFGQTGGDLGEAGRISAVIGTGGSALHVDLRRRVADGAHHGG